MSHWGRWRKAAISQSSFSWARRERSLVSLISHSGAGSGPRAEPQAGLGGAGLLSAALRLCRSAVSNPLPPQASNSTPAAVHQMATSSKLCPQNPVKPQLLAVRSAATVTPMEHVYIYCSCQNTFLEHIFSFFLLCVRWKIDTTVKSVQKIWS